VRTAYGRRVRLILLGLSCAALLASVGLFTGIGITQEDHCAGVDDEAACLAEIDERMSERSPWQYARIVYSTTALVCLGTGWSWLGGVLVRRRDHQNAAHVKPRGPGALTDTCS